jgi:hypothetical protein
VQQLVASHLSTTSPTFLHLCVWRSFPSGPFAPFFYGSKNLSSHIHVEHFARQYSVHVRCDTLLTDIILLLVIFMILIVHYSVISIFDVLNCMSRVMSSEEPWLGMGQKRIPYNTLCCTTISTLMNKNEWKIMMGNENIKWIKNNDINKHEWEIKKK